MSNCCNWEGHLINILFTSLNELCRFLSHPVSGIIFVLISRVLFGHGTSSTRKVKFRTFSKEEATNFDGRQSIENRRKKNSSDKSLTTEWINDWKMFVFSFSSEISFTKTTNKCVSLADFDAKQFITLQNVDRKQTLREMNTFLFKVGSCFSFFTEKAWQFFD